MGARLSFFGGVGEVTGSRHLLDLDGARLLLDCGLVQGHRRESIAKNARFAFEASEVAAALLSHAHVDHSGALPLLVKRGFPGPIHCAAPTDELCAVMLMDAAHLQAEDARFFNKIHAREGVRIEPLYDDEDVRACLARFKAHAYEASVAAPGGATVRFLNAGHVLGSAMIQVDFGSGAGRRRLLFTGDLGRRKSFLLEPPKIPEGVDVLIVESTYGGRRHEALGTVEESLTKVILRAVAEKGKILIPSFALERTQELLYVLEKLRRARAIPEIPIFVDSPMATSLTEVFAKRLGSQDDLFGLERVECVRRADDSKALNDKEGPLIIISASGMCEGGRILHHLRNNIGEDTTTILIVGYQAQGTLGRRLVDGARKVKIFGLEHEVWARVEVLHSFSAHADADDLLWFVGSLSPRPGHILLVHGDDREREALSSALSAAGVRDVFRPAFGEAFRLA
jgi:metallo-beta-lactamase family protein